MDFRSGFKSKFTVPKIKTQKGMSREKKKIMYF